MSQADIARSAGVTQAAVSMILRGKADSIPEQTRQRVLAVARELGYRADPLARRLAAGRSQVLGVFTYERIFGAAQRNLYQPFMLGIEEGAEAMGHDILLFTSAATSGPVRSLYAGGENKLRLVDAAVLLGRDEIPAELEELMEQQYPFVFIGRRFLADGQEVPSVAPDYTKASRSLARELASLGHRRVAYLGSTRGLQATTDRLAGLRAGDLEVATHFQAPDEVGTALVERFQQDGVTAVVAENVAHGEAVRRAAGRLGLGLPARLSIAVSGIAGDREADHEWSGFLVPGREIGRLAVEEVLARLDGGPARTRLVDCPEHPGRTIARPGLRQ